MTKLGNPLTVLSVKLTLPTGVTFVPGSLKVNDTASSTAITAAGVSVPVSGLNKVGDVVTVSYQYKLPAKAAQQIVTNVATLTGKLSIPGSTATDPTTPMVGTFITNQNTINQPAEDLVLKKAPSQVDFGQDILIPNALIKLKGAFGQNDSKFDVNNSYVAKNPWTLSAQVTKDFKSAAGDSLINQLIYNQGGTQKTLSTTGATAIYSNDGTDKGDVILNANDQDSFYLQLNANSQAKADTTYSAEITWSLSSGPTS